MPNNELCSLQTVLVERGTKKRPRVTYVPQEPDEIAVEARMSGRRVQVYHVDLLEAVLRLSQRGCSSAECAERLNISPRHVQRFRAELRARGESWPRPHCGPKRVKRISGADMAHRSRMFEDVAALLAGGASVSRIAAQLDVHPRTASKWRKRVLAQQQVAA